MRIFLMIVWTILCISTSLVVLLVTFSRKMPLVMARTIWSPGILFIASAKTTVTGLENIEKGKTYIVAANHSSYLDIPIAFRVLPLNLHFIAKKELKKVPFLGWYMMATGMIFINRSNNRESSKSLKDAAKLIQHGKTVLIFPEGTVSSDGEIKRFKKGGFHLALEAGVEVLPMSIKGANEVWPTNSNTNFKKGTVKVNIGKPISIKNYTYSQLNDIALDVKTEVDRLKALN